MSASPCHISDLKTKNTVFMGQSISGRSALFLPLPGNYLATATSFGDSSTCEVPYSYLGITPMVSVFSWIAAISLGLLTCVRVVETIKDGRHIFHQYDVVGLRPESTEADAAGSTIVRRPNGLKVLLGVRLWDAHFEFVI